MLEQGLVWVEALKFLEMLELEGAQLMGGVLDFTIVVSQRQQQENKGCLPKVTPQGQGEAKWMLQGLLEYNKGWREKRVLNYNLYIYGTGSVVVCQCEDRLWMTWV